MFSFRRYQITEDNKQHEPHEGGRPEQRRLAKAFALSVAYGANIGGIATLTGTPPNLVLKEQSDK